MIRFSNYFIRSLGRFLADSQSVSGNVWSSNSVRQISCLRSCSMLRMQNCSSCLLYSKDSPIPLSVVPRRFFASKNIQKDRRGPKKLEIPSDDLQEVLAVQEYELALKNLTKEFEESLTKQFSLKASAASLESIMVNLGTEEHQLQEIAQIASKNQQTLMINLAASPEYVKPVLKALESSGLNLNPQTEGNMIYMSIPKVSREHRENLAKNAKANFEKFKERLRKIQNMYVASVNAKTEHPKDLLHNVVQLIMDKAKACEKDLATLLAAKQKELLNVEK